MCIVIAICEIPLKKGCYETKNVRNENTDCEK